MQTVFLAEHSVMQRKHPLSALYFQVDLIAIKLVLGLEQLIVDLLVSQSEII